MDVIGYAPILRWPPTVEDLKVRERQPPQYLIEFVILLMQSTHHSPGEKVKRYSLSISQDLVHAVFKGQFITVTHILIGAGLHSLTGQMLPIHHFKELRRGLCL